MWTFFLDSLYPLVARCFRRVVVFPQSASFRSLAKVSPQMMGGFLNPRGRTLQQYCCFFVVCLDPATQKQEFLVLLGREKAACLLVEHGSAAQGFRPKCRAAHLCARPAITILNCGVVGRSVRCGVPATLGTLVWRSVCKASACSTLGENETRPRQRKTIKENRHFYYPHSIHIP